MNFLSRNFPCQFRMGTLLAGALRLEIDGAGLQESVQLAAPVDPAIPAGEQVFF